MTLASCIYEGELWHRRFQPVDHQFRYQLFLMYLDLDELSTVFRGRWFWSVERPNLAAFRRCDHLGERGTNLSESVRDLVEARLGTRPAGPIRLLTNLRYAGFRMNPVSFYYCYDRAGERVTAVVAEVNNTPWDERHCYVLKTQDALQTDSVHRLPERVPKRFHVSPFMPMELEYEWALSPPGEELIVGITNWKSHERMFDAKLTLHRRPMTSANLARVLTCYPVQTLRVYTAIYWQAWRLWRKGVPYVPHPPPSTETAVRLPQERISSKDFVS